MHVVAVRVLLGERLAVVVRAREGPPRARAACTVLIVFVVVGEVHFGFAELEGEDHGAVDCDREPTVPASEHHCAEDQFGERSEGTGE